jgi:dihydropteroate synthase
MRESRPPRLRLRGQSLRTDAPLIMGVLNASPESFSGDGRPLVLAEVTDSASSLVAAGADILDVGGQSAVTNRPELDEEAEVQRILPVLEYMASQHPEVVVSIDAYRPRVVEAALKAGASIVNDVSGLLYPEVIEACVTHDAALVVMHTRARPKVRLQDEQLYGSSPDGVVDDVVSFLEQKLELATSLGLDRDALIVDPGPDFTKTPQQTLVLLQNLERIRNLERPVLLALSRKDFLGAITQRRPADRAAATHAAIALLAGPASIVRVHDVAATRDVLDTVAALEGRLTIDPTYRLSDELRYQNPPS